MGLRMESGGRRSPASDHQAVVIPRCGPASPFKGHLSTKSNAFCIDSSQSLTNQYLIRDHLMFHYNKILSAKAAVDCSVPRSRLTSIKFADQQRREKLKKKIAKCEKEMSEGKNGSRSSSRENGRMLSSSLGKSSLEAEDTDLLFPSAQRAHYWPRALLPPDEQDLVRSSPVKHSRKYSRNPSNTSNSSVRSSSPLRKTSGLSCSCSTDSFVSVSHSQQRQETKSKVYSRDLLDRHSDFFTNSQQPFTPRTLISDAKSFLSQYRYYTPARRKRKSRYKQQVDAETQTDVTSFPSAEKASERKAMTEHQMIAMKAEDKRRILDKSERQSALQYSFPRSTPLYSEQPSARRQFQSEEEELLYLTFIEDVTNEILKFGLYSNRVLEELFEYHIQENKHHLDERKMRHLLDVLKEDLGGSWRDTARPPPLDTLQAVEELGLVPEGQSQRRAAPREELLRSRGSLLAEPTTCDTPGGLETSRERQRQGVFSPDVAKMLNAGTDTHSSAKSDCGLGTSPTFNVTLNSVTCDSDLESSRDLDELEESFAEALQLSPGYPE